MIVPFEEKTAIGESKQPRNYLYVKFINRHNHIKPKTLAILGDHSGYTRGSLGEHLKNTNKHKINNYEEQRRRERGEKRARNRQRETINYPFLGIRN